jgi:hypothetical protein
MIADNLRLLLRLYFRPRAALSGIVDEASLLFGAASVLAVSLLFQAGTLGPAVGVLLSQIHGGAATSSPAESGDLESLGYPESPEAELDPLAQFATSFLTSSAFATFGNVVALALLYVPGAVLVAGLLGRRSSFGVAMQRDYGPVAACAFLVWTASHLPFALIGLGLFVLPPTGAATWLFPLGLWIGAALYFGVLMVVAFDVALGIGLPAAVGTALLAPAALLARPFLGFLASPFLLICAWLYLRGSLGDIQWSLGARRSFKRYLEAATLNPRDASAHYELGLIHQRRGQLQEAIGRFQRAVEIDPEECDAHYQLGRIARQQGRHEDAIRHFEAVVAQDEAHAHHEIWREVGATYVDAGDLAHARSFLERFVEKRPWDPEGLFLFGDALAELGEPDRAREHWERCVESARTAPDYRRGELEQWRRRAEQRLKSSPPK